MLDAKPITTPFATSPTLELHNSIVFSNPIEYQTIIGSLHYLSLTQLGIAFKVNKLSQFMHRLTSDHWTAIKCLFQYLCGTSNHGLVLYYNYSFFLHAFSNVDWASNRDEFTSTSAHIFYLGCNPIS